MRKKLRNEKLFMVLLFFILLKYLKNININFTIFYLNMALI